MTSEEDYLTGRLLHRKITSQEDDLTGRQDHRKTNSQEVNLTEIQHQRKTTSQEDLREDHLSGNNVGWVIWLDTLELSLAQLSPSLF